MRRDQLLGTSPLLDGKKGKKSLGHLVRRDPGLTQNNCSLNSLLQTNPALAHRPFPSSWSAQVPMRVFHRRTAKMIAQRLCYLRRESAFSPESAAGSSELNLMEVLSALLRGESERRRS